MKRVRLYLDTSVISYLMQDDAPDKMKDTLNLWEEIKGNKYDVFISSTTLQEITRCYEPKRGLMYDCLADISYTVLEITDEVEAVAEQIINLGILKPKSYDDSVHMAAAIVNTCDYIVSWNFKHIVNVKTINGIRAITNLQNYKNIDIVSPTMLIQNGDE